MHSPEALGSVGKLVYSMAGEGRGHATRARALADALGQHHEVVLWAPGQAYELLAPIYRGTAVRVERLPGLRFRYGRSQRLNYTASLLRAAPFARALPRLVRTYGRRLEQERADLAICDFEPILSRAASRIGIPLLGVDHQSFLLVNDLAGLPWRLRAWAKLMAGFCRLMTHGVQRRVVSSFYFPPLKRSFRDKVEQIGVLIRPGLREWQPRDEGHVLVYVRREAPDAFLRALTRLGRPVHAYGLGVRTSEGNIRFHEISAERFAEHLVGCHALVTTAGNQGVGEALFFGKPVLAMPEHGNREQQINAWFLAHSGAGTSAPLERTDGEVLQSFLDRHGEYQHYGDLHRVDGLAAARRIIDTMLGAGQGAPASDKGLVRARPGPQPGRQGALIRP